MNLMKNLNEILPDIYHIESAEPVGKGSSAEVWKVRHKAWNRFLAVKVLSNIDAAENIRNECSQWSKLGMHPNIVNCYYVKDLENIPCIFCEWCDGGSLHEQISQSSPVLYPEEKNLRLEKMLGIAIQVMLGLQYTHSVGEFCHGDVKPQNILLTKTGQAKLTDFGCAGIKGVSGTREYFSPEQLALYEQDESVLLTPATDVYSWAVTVLEMFCGGKTWDCGTKVPGIFREMQNKEMPDELIALLEECLSLHPDDRPDDSQILHKLGEIYSRYCNSDLYSNAENLILNTKYYETADFCNNRALSFIDMEQYDNANLYFRKAIEISPHHSAAIYNKAIFDWLHGNNKFDIVSSVVSSLNHPDVKKFAEQQCSKVKDFEPVKILKNGIPDRYDVKTIQFSCDSRAVKIVYKNQENFCLEIESENEINPDSCQWEDMHHDAIDRLGRHIQEFSDRMSYFCDGNTKTRKVQNELTSIYEKYTFNKDGSLFAILNDDSEIDIREFDLGDDFGYWMCEIQTFEELAEKYRKFNDLMNRFSETSDTSEKITLLTELEPLKDIGGDCLEQYFKAKESLYHCCIRQNIRIGAEIFYSACQDCIEKIIMSEDGRYILFFVNHDCGSLIDTKKSEDISLDWNVDPCSEVKQLNVTKKGEFQVIYSCEDQNEKEILCLFTFYPEDVGEIDVQNWSGTEFYDVDKFISENKNSLVPKPRIPFVIKQECQKKNYVYWQINRAYTRLLAVTKKNEMIIYHLDYDLSV